MSLRIGVVGAGGFGRAIALASARNGQEVTLWSRKERALPEPIRTSTDMTSIRDCEVVFVAVPARHAAPVAEQLGEVVDGSHLIVHISRGLVGGELKTLTQVIREKTVCRRIGALAGPLVADALAEGRPSGAILGTGFPELTAMVREAIGGSGLRIYDTRDVVGVELASATVGFLTVVIGYAQETGAAPGTLAVLATRGMVEMSRVGKTLGAEESTFMGLAGLGDLIAAVAGDQRPELRLGRALARGSNLETAIGELGAYVEGFEVAKHLLEHARRNGLETPISSTFVAMSEGRMSPNDAIQALMERRVGTE
ncbi:MAG: NAD(P)-binding domain-containing protein [Myxococcales bacterium]|nr:MAG: NAD(P)-binding domain-containing protein [Myxococcales bacterium]